MQNIVVVSIDTELAYNTAKKIADIMNFQYQDADSMFKDRIVNMVDYPIDFADDLMRNVELNLLKELSKIDKSVVAITDDMFLSNTGIKHFENSLKICVKKDVAEDILSGLQDLLLKKCDVAFYEKDLDHDKLIKILTNKE